MNRKLKRLALTSLLKISEPMHDWVVRSLFSTHLPHQENEIINYKIAETEEEISQALKLIQESYVDSEITNKQNEEYSVNKFKLAPTTTIFVAKRGNEVVATVSQIMDTSLGLPIEKFTNIDHLRKRNKKISEISGLAIKKSYRKSNGQSVYLQLVTYAVLYTRDILGVQLLVIMTRASAKDFYRALFGYKPIDGELKPYTEANNMVSYAQYSELDQLENILLKLYGKHRPLHKNLYKICKDSPWKEFLDNTPPKYNIIFNRSFNLKTIEYFFKLKSDVLETLPSQDLQFFKFMYNDEHYQSLLEAKGISNLRRNPRYYANMEITSKSNEQAESFKIIEISKSGFSVLNTQSNLPQEIYGHIHLNSTTPCFIQAELIWKNDNKAGYCIKVVDNILWKNLFDWIHEIHSKQLAAPSEEKKAA